MPRLDEEHDTLLDAGENTKKRVRRAWDGFGDFALQDNVLEVAVGLILAAAFTVVVRSFVSDIILPLISLIFPGSNLEEKFAVLRHGPSYASDSKYNTVKQALDDGAVVMAYGSFFDNVINFLGVAIALYTIAQVYGWASNDAIIKHTVKCKYCGKRISEKVISPTNISLLEKKSDKELLRPKGA